MIKSREMPFLMVKQLNHHLFPVFDGYSILPTHNGAVPGEFQQGVRVGTIQLGRMMGRLGGNKIPRKVLA